MDSHFHGNDREEKKGEEMCGFRKRWIPVFMGMTEKMKRERNRGRFSVPSLIIRYVINVNVMVE